MRSLGDAWVGSFRVPDLSGVMDLLMGQAYVGCGGNYFWSGSNWAGFGFDFAPLLSGVVFFSEAHLGAGFDHQCFGSRPRARHVEALSRHPEHIVEDGRGYPLGNIPPCSHSIFH